jgi:hypothetical protein
MANAVSSQFDGMYWYHCIKRKDASRPSDLPEGKMSPSTPMHLLADTRNRLPRCYQSQATSLALYG